MNGIRIEGISSNGGKLVLVIDPKHILTVLTVYEDVLPCPAFNVEQQYYVIFYPNLELNPIITAFELSPGIQEWIDKHLDGTVY